jgi:hypothetical protein
MQRQVCRTPSPRPSPNVGAKAARCLYNNDHLIFVASGVGSSEHLLTLRCAGRHALAAARPGADQHKPADKLRLGERELLRDEPSEKPSTSTWVGSSALMKAAALAAISSTEVGTSPELLEIPALLNRMTSRSLAKPSVTAGSRWSMVPV